MIAINYDQRQSVTPTQHAVLDLIDRRDPMWQMMHISDLYDLVERELCGERRPSGPDHIRLAALCLHLAERHHARAHTGAGAITDLAAVGISFALIDGCDEAIPMADDYIDEITGCLIDAAADELNPVLRVHTMVQADDLHAVLVPTALDAEGHATDHHLQFHPTAASALRARLAASEQGHNNG